MWLPSGGRGSCKQRDTLLGSCQATADRSRFQEARFAMECSATMPACAVPEATDTKAALAHEICERHY